MAQELSSLQMFLTTIGLIVAIVILRYFMVSGFFAWITQRRHPSKMRMLTSQIALEKKFSVLSAVIYGLATGFTLWAWSALGWTNIYTEITLVSAIWAVAAVPIYLFLHDTYYYWLHRWMHRPRVYRAIHYTHHKSHPPTAWAAMNFHAGESILGAIFIPVMVFIVPIHIASLAIVATIASITGTTNHLGWEILPKKVVNSIYGKMFITASHHEQHHRKNRCNYGLYFRFWDKICGTDRDLAVFASEPSAALFPAPSTAERAHKS